MKINWKKVSKQSVVVVGNIFVKLLILNVETIKWISLRIREHIITMMDKDIYMPEITEETEEKEENNFEIIDKKNQ